jgi:photosystem II cytochrome c550
MKNFFSSKNLGTIILSSILFFFTISNFTLTNSSAFELTEAVLTVPLNTKSSTLLRVDQFTDGKIKFINTCSTCHKQGGTNTDPEIGLDTLTLHLATPRRDTIDGLVDYIKNPTTFDGKRSIATEHPSVKRADLFPQLKSLTEDDLFNIAGYILVAPKLSNEKWGGGKVYY